MHTRGVAKYRREGAPGLPTKGMRWYNLQEMMKRWTMSHFEGDTLAEFNSESDMRRGKVAFE